MLLRITDWVHRWVAGCDRAWALAPTALPGGQTAAGRNYGTAGTLVGGVLLPLQILSVLPLPPAVWVCLVILPALLLEGVGRVLTGYAPRYALLLGLSRGTVLSLLIYHLARLNGVLLAGGLGTTVGLPVPVQAILVTGLPLVAGFCIGGGATLALGERDGLQLGSKRAGAATPPRPQRTDPPYHRGGRRHP